MSARFSSSNDVEAKDCTPLESARTTTGLWFDTVVSSRPEDQEDSMLLCAKTV